MLVPSKKGLEKVIGDDDFVDIASWLYNALNLSKSVCKVETEEGESGTGFLLKGGFVMTNSHVIASKEQANSTRIIFNYMVDKENNVMDHVIYPLDSSLFVSSPEDELDYAIVKVNDTNSVPLSEWGFVELETFFNPKIGQKVTIIQHPNGNYKKMALPDDVIGNQTLLDLSLLYENVHFIDLRNTVPQNASFWHDEIHPNDEGFKLVADKFIATLKSIGV